MTDVITVLRLQDHRVCVAGAVWLHTQEMTGDSEHLASVLPGYLRPRLFRPSQWRCLCHASITIWVVLV